MSFEIRVPASSANLGPGFDSLALALDMPLRVRVHTGPEPAGQAAVGVELHGGEDLVLAGMRRAAQELGRELEPCVVEVESDIPVARGLGSSAAAIVAGLQAGALVTTGSVLSSEQLISLGGMLEGHADNVAAAVLGGVTVAISTGSGYRAARLIERIAWQAVLFVPSAAAFTREARGVLPVQVPLSDAAANVGRAALLVHALTTGNDELLAEAMSDRLHQPYRAALFPHLQAMIEAARLAGAAGVCLSGAGPAVLALAAAHHVDAVGAALQDAGCRLGVPGTVRMPGVATRGIVVERARA
jgi:homoserine kinase